MNAPADFSISSAMIGAARRESEASERPIGEVLASLTGLDEETVMRSVCRQAGYPWVDSRDLMATRPLFERLSLAKCLQRDIVVVVDTALDRQLNVISDPFDGPLLDWIVECGGEESEIAVARRADIHAYLLKQEESVRAMEGLVSEGSETTHRVDDGERISLSLIAEDSSPIVRIVNSTIYDALKSGASDVHLETTPHGLEVKYRIDGVLESVQSFTGAATAEQVISRIKVLAELDIAERRVPQDGRIKISISGRSVDLRVSIMPSIYGEDAVLRILDKRNMVADGSPLTLEMLGFTPLILQTVRRLAHAPHGMLLVTGPTGSGKTTTLYAALSEINSGKDKIVTIEDPVEYELPGVLQIPVNEKKGLTFARGLRSILRHDPDRIMVGEIRDSETAEIAVQSALTGHLVVTTVHANNVYDVFSRFTHMSVGLHVLTSALNGIWAQRLIRTVCKRCAAAYAPEAAEIELLNITGDELQNYRFMRGGGCGDCRGSGYRGRKAIAEVLVMTDSLRQLISERAPLATIKAEAQKGGTRSLRSSALDLLKQGLTSIEEVDRMTLGDA